VVLCNLKKLMIVSFALAQAVFAEYAGAGMRLRIDEGWRFHRGDIEHASGMNFADKSWRELSLPHDWSIESSYSPDNTPQNSWLPGGIGWYRRTIQVPDSWLNQKVMLRFEGVYMNSRVWLNGHEVGGRPYGFMTFSCDLNRYLHKGSNQLAVRVDNTPVPTSRFYHGGGIYGHADLLVLPAVHVVPDGGVFVRTTGIRNLHADIAVDAEIRNITDDAAVIAIRHRIFDCSGKQVAESLTESVKIGAESTRTVKCTIGIDNAALWSPDSPSLYRIKTTVKSDGKTIDVNNSSFGIRTVEFKADTGFWLNGENIKIKGVCEHQELGPMGLAVPDDLIRWRIETLKSMGCNAIRTAHNPFTPTFYHLCDRLGIMVVDEIFDGWHKKGANDYGGRFFADWWQRDVTDLVRRDRSHPSVILYSIGNETGTRDKYDITGFIHKLDSTRFTTGGTVFFGVDISGFNGPGGMVGVLEKFHSDHPQKPIILTEVPHTIQTRGFYRVPTWWRDGENKKVHKFTPYGTKQIFFDGHSRYRSSYDNCGVRINARTCWKRTRDTPWISGEFRWTGFDCMGEAQFMGSLFPKRIYNSGVIDLAGFPKDLFYFYRSQWTDSPMVHLFPHWTHPDLKVGTIIPVVAYSNCDEVELILNGKSLGRRSPGELLDFIWQVPWNPGLLKAIAYRKAAEYPPPAFGAGGQTALLTVSALDADGIAVPWVNNRVDFHLDGDIHLPGYENGNPVDGTAHHESWRNMFYGLARGFYRLGSGQIVVTAVSVLGEKLFEGQTAVAIDCRQIALRGKQPTDKITIYYTLDGSEPGAESKIYTGPFEIDRTTTVRCLVMCGKERLVTTQAEFTKENSH